MTFYFEIGYFLEKADSRILEAKMSYYCEYDSEIFLTLTYATKHVLII